MIPFPFFMSSLRYLDQSFEDCTLKKLLDTYIAKNVETGIGLWVEIVNLLLILIVKRPTFCFSSYNVKCIKVNSLPFCETVVEVEKQLRNESGNGRSTCSKKRFVVIIILAIMWLAFSTFYFGKVCVVIKLANESVRVEFSGIELWTSIVNNAKICMHGNVDVWRDNIIHVNIKNFKCCMSIPDMSPAFVIDELCIAWLSNEEVFPFSIYSLLKSVCTDIFSGLFDSNRRQMFRGIKVNAVQMLRCDKSIFFFTQKFQCAPVASKNAVSIYLSLKSLNFNGLFHIRDITIAVRLHRVSVQIRAWYMDGNNCSKAPVLNFLLNFLRNRLVDVVEWNLEVNAQNGKLSFGNDDDDDLHLVVPSLRMLFAKHRRVWSGTAYVHIPDLFGCKEHGSGGPTSACGDHDIPAPLLIN